MREQRLEKTTKNYFRPGYSMSVGTVFLVLFSLIFCFLPDIFAQKLRLMTYNIRYDNPNDGAHIWENRKQLLADQINQLQPDVMGTQEGMIHQLKFLDSALVNMDYVGGGRDDGKLAGEFSALFYNTRKFQLMQSGTFWLSETPGVPSKGWDAMLNRVCTFARLRDKKTKKEYWTFNVHFDHIGEKARLESAKLLLQRTESQRQAGTRVIIMGDFNLVPEAEPVKLLKNIFIDAFDATENRFAEQPGSFNGFDLHKPAHARIDYIFLSTEGFKVRRYEMPVLLRNGIYPSDHFPVLVEVE